MPPLPSATPLPLHPLRRTWPLGGRAEDELHTGLEWVELEMVPRINLLLHTLRQPIAALAHAQPETATSSTVPEQRSTAKFPIGLGNYSASASTGWQGAVHQPVETSIHPVLVFES